MSLSLQTRIFIGVVSVGFLILAIVWYGVRPAYEQKILNERITIVQQIQNYTVETIDKQLADWIAITRGITQQLYDRPVEGESFIRHTMILHPEIIRIRISSPSLPDELVSQNIHYQEPVEEHFEEQFILSSDTLIRMAWLPQSVVTRSSFEINNVTFYATIWWDSKQLQQLFQQLPFGTDYAVAFLSSVNVVYSNTDSSFVSLFQLNQAHISTMQQMSYNEQQWYGVTSVVSNAPLFFIVAIPESDVRQPVQQLLQYTIYFVAALLSLLLIGGWILSYQISKPINRLVKDVEQLSTLDFSKPIRSTGMKNIRSMAETIELMRQSLERYQKLNVEKIIIEEWKNKLFMMHSEDLIALTDSEGKYVFKNNRFDDFCSTISSELQCSSIQELLTLPSVSITKEVRRQENIENELTISSRQAELKIKIPDEGLQYYRINDIAITRNGQSLGALVILHDLTNDRLIDKMKNEMINIIVHELRSPVGSIIGFADILVKQDDIEEQERKEFLGYILESGHRLLNLINRFLDISRLESRRIEYPKVPTNIIEIVHNVIESVQPQLRTKNLKVEVEIDNSIPYAIIAPELIREAILNLVANAIKYGDPDRTINIQLRQANGSIQFVITDHGYGIPIEAQEKLFTKFYRVANPKAQKEVGTGLGLAYVKEIVMYHNGEISLESNAEIGCRFTISIPVGNK